VALVHQLRIAECSDAEVLSAHALLDAEERDKAGRFVFEEHRRLYTLAHGMLRRVLGAALNQPPEAIRFSIGEHGKPSVAGIEFNLSHTDGCVVVAIGRDPIGVDVEHWDRGTDILGVCDRFFAKSEAAALRALPEHAQRERFFRYWTLKEAYIKARGMGLAIPLGDFAFDLAGEQIQIAFAPQLIDDPMRWRFAQMIQDRFIIAVATSERDQGLELA
jgi:4'-phosphopantetheinyl transferase